MQNLASWRPPKLVRGPEATTSEYSRPLAWWDRHLAEPLILQNVVLTEGVGTHLVDLFDTIMAHLWTPSQAVPQQFIAKMQSNLDSLHKVRKKEVNNEAQIEACHLQFAPALCEVASNLFLAHLLSEHPAAFDPFTFTWDVSFLEQTKASGAAPLTDLIDLVEALSPDAPHHANIPSDLKSIIERMAREELINTEAKFDTVTTPDVMREIEGLVGTPYACTDSEGPKHAVRQTHKIVSPPRTADGETYQKLAAQLQPTPPTTCLSQPASPSSQPAPSFSHRGHLKRSAPDVSYAEAADDDEERPSGKRQKADDDGYALYGKRIMKSAAEATGASKTARAWLQQTWAQSVYIDSTFLRFVAMNWEMVGLRNRASNTLYLTQLQPHVAGSPFSDDYAKVQIALKIAALIDWRERHPEDNLGGGDNESEDHWGEGRGARGDEGRGEGRGNEDGGGEGLGGEERRGQGRGVRGGHGDEDRADEGYGDDSNGGRSQPEQGEFTVNEFEPFAAANSSARGQQYSASNKEYHPVLRIDGERPMQAFPVQAPAHTLRIWVQYGPFDSPQPARFVSTVKAGGRSSEQLANDVSLWDGNAGCADVYLRQAIVPGIACSGVLGPLGSQTSVFVKLAFTGNEGQVERLLYEHRIYTELGPIRGIPVSFGLYETVDEGGPHVLVLDHCGQSLEELSENSSSFQLTQDIKNSFLSILADIHHAGYLHNDLALRNLLLSSTGEPVITDFGMSMKGTRKSMEAETRELELLLNRL
ncbi:hypothetical protein GGX14DRAFT_663021 [Mycena pura]|uniref:Protein kinase domain-containing protein n=1 Tax=Mycena pura TaxID=153505 RepID=A0AAD6VU65_9AGAR|nr:hypothetical protein GGX14DRAFT_663021 [Mycena pura]